MRDALLCLLLLTLALFALNASGEKQVHRILRKSGMQKKNIWRQMRKNTAALKKLALAEYETQLSEINQLLEESPNDEGDAFLNPNP